MILVTGGLGMIGAHAARALAELGHDVRLGLLPGRQAGPGLRPRHGGRRLPRLARRQPPLKEHTHA